MVPDNYAQRVIHFAQQGFREISFPTYDIDWDSDAYLTVAGQNSNNSVCVTDDFLKAVQDGGSWDLKARTDDAVVKTVDAGELWDKVSYAAWSCADPGIQYDTTINDWHTCPQSGRINASNPCSEYMFLDDTACNLASLNLMTFREDDGSFDVDGFIHAVRLWTITLEIAVLMAQFPSREIARLSYEFRTLGLGYANIGGLLTASGLPYDSDEGRALCASITALMTGICYVTSAEMAVLMAQFPSREIARLSYEFRTLGLGYANIGGLLTASGLPYDSDEGRALCASITALMTGICYVTSAEMAEEIGTFPGYDKNAADMLRVIRNHRRAAHGETKGYEALATLPVPLDHANCPDTPITEAAKAAWDLALESGEKHGYRNAQTTVVAPTGTIGLVMDCDTAGIEPDFAPVKFKKLAARLLQDHQSHGTPSASGPGLYAQTDRRDGKIRRRPWLTGRRSGHQSHDPRRKGLWRRSDRRDRGRTGNSLRYLVRLQQLDPGRSFLHRDPGP